MVHNLLSISKYPFSVVSLNHSVLTNIWVCYSCAVWVGKIPDSRVSEERGIWVLVILLKSKAIGLGQQLEKMPVHQAYVNDRGNPTWP